MSAPPQREPEPAIAFIPTVLTPELVSPLSVYATGRESFECVLRAETEKYHAKAVIFVRMRLEEFGWEYQTAHIESAGRDKDGFPIWRLERG